MPPILIVDDDADIREALAELLADEGHAVAVAENGRDALRLLRAGPPPCLILLDIMMPVLDGFGFLEERAQDPRLAPVPVVVITASGRDHVPGTQGVLRKPVDVQELLETAAAHCR